jgi:hypothetical protein
MWSRKRGFLTLIISIILLLVLKYTIDNSTDAIPQALKLIAQASLPVAGGLITLSSCFLLGTLSNVRDSATSHLSRRISEDPARNFTIGFLVTAYLTLVRSPLIVNLPFIPYIEWVTIVLAVYVMYNMASPSTTESDLSPEDLGWKKHQQTIRREIGRDLTRTTSVIEQFVDYGVKEPLLVYFALHLQRLGKTEEEILKTLSPLISYEENAGRSKLHFLAFPRTRRKLDERNKKERETLLSSLSDKIDGLGS